MADYIDRQAAIAALRKFAESCNGSTEAATAVSVAISVLSRVPSPWADAKAHPPEKNATDEPPHWNSEGTHGLTALSWMPSPDLPKGREEK